MSNPQNFDTRERKGMPAPTGATPAPDKGTVGIVLAGGAKQAAAASPRVLGHSAW